MEAWGGNDDWDFEFEPEILKQQPVKVPAQNHYDYGDDNDNHDYGDGDDNDDHEILKMMKNTCLHLAIL